MKMIRETSDLDTKFYLGKVMYIHYFKTNRGV